MRTYPSGWRDFEKLAEIKAARDKIIEAEKSVSRFEGRCSDFCDPLGTPQPEGCYTCISAKKLSETKVEFWALIRSL